VTVRLSKEDGKFTVTAMNVNTVSVVSYKIHT